MSAPIFGSFGRIGTALLAALAVCILPVGDCTRPVPVWAPIQVFVGRSGFVRAQTPDTAITVSFRPPHGNGNCRFRSAPTRARLPFRSGRSTNRGTAITVSFRPPHGNGNCRFVQAPTRARLPFRFQAREPTGARPSRFVQAQAPTGARPSRFARAQAPTGARQSRSVQAQAPTRARQTRFIQAQVLNTSAQNLNWRRNLNRRMQ